VERRQLGRGGASVRFVDETDFGFGWLASEEKLARCAHALAADGRVWLIDALDAPAIEPRVRELGEPAGVVQLLDRHARDSAEVAARLGVPHFAVPIHDLPGSGVELVRVVDSRFWRELAAWIPSRRALVCADALGTAGYFRAGEEPLAVHPFLRVRPPRVLARFEPEHILCGHGAGVHGPETAEALREALRTARRRLPRALAGAFRR
jgi:hypothetical protein